MGFKNILVTGSNGMLGQDLIPYLRAKGYTIYPSTTEYLNLLETQDIMKEKLGQAKPDLVIHAAAYTDVDGAESNPELAMAINKDGTQKLALAAKELGAIFVYISTDFVFDGLKRTPYTPADRPNPVNTYGLSKYYGELMISEYLEAYYIIRTSWLYGIHKKNFAQFVLDSARQGRSMTIAEDLIGSPTWTGSLCVAIENIMTSGAFGTYHASDDGEVSRFNQALMMCKAAGFSTDLITPVHSNELSMAANRPQYSALDCGELSVPSWETSFYAYLEQYKRRYMPDASSADMYSIDKGAL